MRLPTKLFDPTFLWQEIIVSQGMWGRENKPGIAFDAPWKWLLLPGVVIQWFLFTFPTGGFAKVVMDTRVARSPLMTYVISGVFYALVVPVLLLLLFGALGLVRHG